MSFVVLQSVRSSSARVLFSVRAELGQVEATPGFYSFRSDLQAEFSTVKDPSTTLLEIDSHNVSSLSTGGMMLS